MIEKADFEVPKIILLVGLMGCGKTSVGKRLAKYFNLPFVDGDNEVETSAGCSISDIFHFYGEAEFRNGEKKVMTRLLDRAPCVIASGGGAYLPEDIRAKAKEKAITIWLKADLDVLEKRTKGKKRRPLLLGENLKEKLQKFIDDRYHIYAEADITVETKDENVSKTLKRTVEAIEKYLKNG
ncbi:MAG: shikimate kinase [Alphaproteobacteria bacterium]